MSEGDTTQLEKEGEKLVEKAVALLARILAKGIVKGIIAAVAAAGVFEGNTIWQAHQTHRQIWTETGDHFGDILNLQAMNRDAILDLSNRVWRLERRR